MFTKQYLLYFLKSVHLEKWHFTLFFKVKYTLKL